MAGLTHWAIPKASTRALQCSQEGWLDSADEIKGQPLGCELGASVLVGHVLGWLDGAAEVDGLSEGMEDGWSDALGNSDSIDKGTPVLVELILGWLYG